jgi:protein tyrosine phosphatase
MVKRWMNKYKNIMPSINNDVKNVKAKINGLKRTNKMGVPFKMDVDLIKKRMVERWKREREPSLERKFIMNQINTNGISPNKREQFRRAATNYIITQGPTKKELNKFKKVWMNLRAK